VKKFLDKRWPWFGAAGVLLLVLLSTFVQIRLPGQWDRRPAGDAEDIALLRDRDDLNVLFILIDTLRAERLGSYGYERDTSPFLDQLANSGVRFGRHLAQSSWTKSSMASLWTGLYPARTGVTRFDQVVPEEAQMAAEVLREAGFQTIGLWRNGWVAPTFGFEQGFELYQRPIAPAAPPNVRIENPTLTDRGTDESLTAVAAEFLRISGNQRWFLYIHMMDLHEYIYDEESALFGAGHSDIYDNSLRWTDETIRLLVETLSDLDLLDNTLIAIASDHGEAFGEHGREGHARDVYGEVTTTPLIFSLPFRLPGPVVVETPTENVDLWPTLLELLKLPPLLETDGRSRLPELMAAAKGETSPSDPSPRFAHIDQNWARTDRDPLPMVSVSDGDYRLLIGASVGGRGRLYDPSQDPREQQEVGAREPERLAHMKELATTYLARAPAPWGKAPEVGLDAAELEQLRALGYGVGP